jgi:hypothetical protein
MGRAIIAHIKATIIIPSSEHRPNFGDAPSAASAIPATGRNQSLKEKRERAVALRVTSTIYSVDLGLTF